MDRAIKQFFSTVIFTIISIVSFLFPAIAYTQNIKPSSATANNSPWHRSMKAVKIYQSIKIDGKLDDPVWSDIEFTGDFIQREPIEGAPATEKTEIAVLYDDKNLYIGARCYDSEPDKIRATEMRRDASLHDDDYFDMFLDTFHDRRSAFYFTTNPLAMRLDGMVSNDGKIDNRNWDGIWACKTSIDDKGWYVEMEIPWQTLRFKEGDNIVWGAHFVRRIIRKNEEDYWRLVPLYAGRLGQYRISEGGDIYGLSGLKMGGKFELKPYVTGGLQRDQQTSYSTKHLKDAGIDIKLNLSSTLTADITYNTDFAQVEADQERVNLTRFDLYFPEKRDFFLEGAETFAFGHTRGRSGISGSSSIQLFYSRKIGLEESQRIPILGGARLYGKSGKYTIGLINMQTDKVNIGSSNAEELSSKNFGVLRIKRDIFTRSSLGIMLLNKQNAAGQFNRSIGFDSNLYVNKNLTVYLVGAGTNTQDNTAETGINAHNLAANVGFSWQSDLWRYSLDYLDIQQNFNPEMGFVRRKDIRRTGGNLTYAPRPKKWDSIRQIGFTFRGYYQTDHFNLELNKQIAGDFTINFENTSVLRINFEREYEYLEYDWQVRTGFSIPKGGYTTGSIRASYTTSRSKAVSGSFNVNSGGYFNGTKSGCGLRGNIKAINRIIANLNYNYNVIELPEGQFHTNTFSTRLSYTFSPDLYIKTYIQWYNDKLLLDGKDRYSGNIILRYEYKPGSHFYFVYNQESLIGPGYESIGNTLLKNRTIITKMTYFFRK